MKTQMCINQNDLLGMANSLQPRRRTALCVKPVPGLFLRRWRYETNRSVLCETIDFLRKISFIVCIFTEIVLELI